jgi:hypothetical protein
MAVATLKSVSETAEAIVALVGAPAALWASGAYYLRAFKSMKAKGFLLPTLLGIVGLALAIFAVAAVARFMAERVALPPIQKPPPVAAPPTPPPVAPSTKPPPSAPVRPHYPHPRLRPQPKPPLAPQGGCWVAGGSNYGNITQRC